MYVYGASLFYIGCSDCVGVCVNVCCVSAVVEDCVCSLGVLIYVVCLCKGVALSSSPSRDCLHRFIMTLIQTSEADTLP